MWIRAVNAMFVSSRDLGRSQEDETAPRFVAKAKIGLPYIKRELGLETLEESGERFK